MSSIQQRWNISAAKPYTKNGEEKKQWIRCGRAVQWADGNIQIEIDAMPCFPGWDGKMSLFPPDEQRAANSGQQRSQQQPARGGDPEDDIGF